MFYVYVLLSNKDGNFYIGCTNDLKRRIEGHNNGKIRSTKSRLPLKLIYYEGYINKENAFRREKFYKSGRGHEVLRKILKETLEKV